MAVDRCILHLRRLPPASVAAAAGGDRGIWTGASDADLGCWTPEWEIGDGGLYLDLTGTGRLLGWGSDGPLRVCREACSLWGPIAGGAAPDRLAAALASQLACFWSVRGRQRAPHLLAVPPGSVGSFLAPFSLSVLAQRFPKVTEVLGRYGVRTVGDLQAVPRAVLAATFGGDPSRELVGEVAGRSQRPLAKRKPPDRCIVAARLSRPIIGHDLEAALRRAFAARAMLACPEGPGAWDYLRLQAAWGRDRLHAVTMSGSGPPTVSAWCRQMTALWRRLPGRRRGLVALRLVVGPRRADLARQGDLFALDRGERLLAEAWQRSRRNSSGGLFWASEAILERWGVRWMESDDPLLRLDPGQKSVGGFVSESDGSSPSGSATGKPASSRR